MNAVFTDSNGNKRNFLWQYDKGQMLIVEDLEYIISPEVHFTTTVLENALIVDGEYSNGVLKVHVPDALLLSANNIIVYLYLEGVQSGETVRELTITVRPRKKPADYIYTDGRYITSTAGLGEAIEKFLDGRPEFIEDIIVDYTEIILTDDETQIKYRIGIKGEKMYIKPIEEVAQDGI